MRRRLLITIVGFTAAIYCGLAIPLAMYIASAQTNWLLGVGAAVVVGVAWWSASALHRWIAAPLRSLGDVARAVGTGQLHERAPTSAGPTEVRYAARSLNTMIEQITELSQRQRTFVSYASHQIRTPLATMQLCADGLEGAVTAAGHDDYHVLTQEIGRLSRICDSLLAYARAERLTQHRPVDICELVDGRHARWLSSATANEVRLVRTGVVEAVAFSAAQVLDQALDALIENSIKYAGAGSTVSLIVSRPFASHVDIHVVDDGAGMSAGDLARAGRAFWQRTQDGHAAGYGLGLTIATALVAAAGGRLHLSQADPHGLSARIRLPAAPGAERALDTGRGIER